MQKAMDRSLGRLYADLERWLVDLNAELLAAESHRVLCARFCVEHTPDAESWMCEVLGPRGTGDLQLRESQQPLKQVYVQTSANFLEAMDGFEMLLPDDDKVLAERVRALTDWCGAFIAELGLVGLRADNLVGGQVGDVSQDLIEITRVDHDVKENEGNEMAYTEVMEYVRMAITMIGLTLRVRNDGQAPHL